MGSPVTKISITDVRTLSGTQHAELAKITLLIGENSVGKSTFAGCLNAIGQFSQLHELNDRTNFFDQKPFCMGSFESIARSGCDSFRIDISLKSGLFRRFALEFTENRSYSAPRQNRLETQMRKRSPESDPGLTIANEASEDPSEHWRFDGPEFQFLLNRSEVSYTQFTTWLSRYVTHGHLPFSGSPTVFRKRMGNTANKEEPNFIKFINFLKKHFQGPPPSFRIIPVVPHGLERKRYYPHNPIKALDNDVDLSAINRVGQKLGLFRQLDVRKLSTDQFEVRVNVSGSYYNLIDIGYGIPSLLPFIIAFCGAPSGSLFLLQQPEVHVHPSAQAGLIKMMSESDHAFVIETHSDHIIAWFRILVRENFLKSSDVAIIYFEHPPEDKSSTRLHQISLDKNSNLIGQPHNYREFFTEETNRLLGFPV